MMKLWPGSRKTMSRVEDVAVAGGRRHVVDVGHSFKLVLMVENDLHGLHRGPNNRFVGIGTISSKLTDHAWINIP